MSRLLKIGQKWERMQMNQLLEQQIPLTHCQISFSQTKQIQQYKDNYTAKVLTLTIVVYLLFELSIRRIDHSKTEFLESYLQVNV